MIELEWRRTMKDGEQQPGHGTRMIAVVNIPGVSILNMVHTYQASRLREDQSEESAGQTR